MNTSTQEPAQILRRTGGTVLTGLLVDVGVDGSPTVDYSGNELGPIPARTVIPSARKGDAVLLVFDHDDPTRPIIIGILQDCLGTSQPRRLRMAAREILLDGAEEVNLRCGESSLTLRKDGKIVLKGREVLTRASRTNRIKGATVQIN